MNHLHGKTPYGKEVLAKWTEGVDNRVVLLVIVGEFLRSTVVAELARVRGIENGSGTTGTLGGHTSDSVVTLQWGWLIFEDNNINARTGRCEDR